MKKQHLGSLIRLAISIVLIIFLFSLIDRQDFLSYIRGLNPVYFLLGLAIYFIANALWALRWYIFIRATGEAIGYLRVFVTTLVGMFFSIFLPTMVGSDLGRMYELSQEQRSKVGVVSSVLLDRLIGLVSLAVMAAVALLFGAKFTGDVPVVEIVVVTAGGMVVGWLVFFNRAVMRHFNWVFTLPIANRLESPLRALYNSLYFLQSQPRLLIWGLVISLVYQSVQITSVIFIAESLGIHLNPVYFFVFLPMIWLVMMIPISVSGLGLREGAFAFFFTQVGLTGAEALAISLLFYSYNIAVGMVGGLSFLRNSIITYRRRLLERHA
jgi:uncharacterized protein (TIRG00374 family)